MFKTVLSFVVNKYIAGLLFDLAIEGAERAVKLTRTEKDDEVIKKVKEDKEAILGFFKRR